MELVHVNHLAQGLAYSKCSINVAGAVIITITIIIIFFLIYLFYYFILFIYCFWLRWVSVVARRAFSSCGEWGLHIAVASLVVEHGL